MCAYTRQNVLCWKKWLFAPPTLISLMQLLYKLWARQLTRIARKCKSLTGKRLARRLRREPLCSSSPPEETPHRTEIGTESGASCNWPAAAVEGSTSCFCPALPHCCSLKEANKSSVIMRKKFRGMCIYDDVKLREWRAGWCKGVKERLCFDDAIIFRDAHFD